MHPHLSRFLSRRLIDRRGGHRTKVLEKYRSNLLVDRADADSVQAEADAALARLLQHAARHVPFFRQCMSVGEVVGPSEARAVLASLPIMRRTDIQERPAGFLADCAGETVKDATGGSTGTPMQFRVDRQTQIAREASLMWSNSLAGWQPGDRIAMLWGSSRDLASSAAGWRLALRWWIENRRWFNAFEMSPEKMDTFHQEMEQFRPHLIVAYAGAAHEFAARLREKGVEPSYPAKAIVSSAEVVTPAVRVCIEEVFGRPVFDRYGNREGGAIAAECVAHEGLHINSADFIIEIDSPDPFNVPGPILLTYLHNYAMPFIRYDTGDLGRVLSDEPCACGRRTLRLSPVSGRQSETIRTADGKLIHGEFFTHLLYGARGVKEFQFVQEDLNRYKLLLVANEKEVETQVSAWKSRIGEAVGQDAAVAVEFVDRIPTSASGKRKFTLSLVGK